MKTAVLILAAGAASRFGSAKQLALIEGKLMLQHCIDNANSFLPGAVYTVLGNQYEEICLKISGTKVIRNHQWRQGLGGSIAVGASYLKDDFDAILVMLADQPRIKCHHLEQLMTLFDGQKVACSFYHNDVGVPAVFGSAYFDALMNLSSDKGAKELLQSIDPIPRSLCLKNSAVDIDYPEDLAMLIQQTKMNQPWGWE